MSGKYQMSGKKIFDYEKRYDTMKNIQPDCMRTFKQGKGKIRL